MGKDNRYLLLVAAAALLVSGVCLGAEGRYPVWQSMPLLAGQEGKYIVTRDIVAMPGQPVIDVAPGTVSVDIDLNGFTLYGGDTDVIRAVGVDSLTVRNGTIHGGQADGIHVEDAQKVVIEDVRIELLEGSGVNLWDARNFVLKRNVIHRVNGTALAVDGGFIDSDPVSGTIEHNTVTECGTGILVSLGSAVAVRNNRLEKLIQGDGIRMVDCGASLVTENTVEEAAGFGIVLELFRVGKIYNNVVYKSGAEGIALLAFESADNLFLHNVSSQNGFNGLFIDGIRNQIEMNVLNNNGQYGLVMTSMATDNSYGRNTLRANQAPFNPARCMLNPPTCNQPDVCIEGFMNSTFGDNMGPNPGC